MPSKRSAQRCVPVRGVDELAGYADPVRGLAHAAFEHVTHAELTADLLHIDGAALVGEARIARDHEQLAEAGERGDDFFHDAVGEILLLRIALMFWNGSTAIEGFVGQARSLVRLENDLFLRPDLRAPSRRAQRGSRMAEGHREAARSVLDVREHGGRLRSRGQIQRMPTYSTSGPDSYARTRKNSYS